MDHEHKISILLVEDEAIIALSEKRELERRGYSVVHASSGEQAIGLFRRDAGIDLILMDIDLGEGIDGTRAALSILADRDIPIIFLSSHTDPETVDKSERIASYGYVVKNSGIIVLDASIKMALKLFNAERALKESEERFRLLAEKAIVGIYINEGERMTYVNPSFARIFGYSPEDICGKLTTRDLIHPDDLEAMGRRYLKRVKGEADESRFSYRGVKKDGSLIRIEGYGSIISYRGRQVVMGTLVDSTDRERSYEELLQHKNLLASIIECSSEAIFAKDLSGRYVTINSCGAQVLGTAADKIIGHTDAEILDPEKARAFQKDDQRILSTGEVVVREASFTKDGEPVTYLAHKSAWRDGSGKIIGTIGISSDISARKRAEEALAYEQYLLKSLLDTSSDYIYFKDRASRFLRTSKAHARLVGLDDPSKMVGKTDFDFFSAAHARQAYEDEQEIIRTGQALKKEEMETWNDKPDTCVLTEKMPLKDQNGIIIGTFGISMDISRRKRADELIQRLLTEKEIILKEVHHRIINNMNTIVSFLSLQAETLQDANAVQALEDASHRVQSMVVLYKILFQSTELNSVPLSDYLPMLVDAIVSNFPNGELVRVEKRFDECELDAKRAQTLGIIVNEIVTNVMKYAFPDRDDGVIRVRGLHSGGRAIISIEDNGNGMPEGIDFEKSPGFGLMLVKELTRQLDGSIRIERGKGTMVVLEFDL